MNAKNALNSKQAIGLLAVGILMTAIPLIRPDWFPPGEDGSSVSAIWLTCMGVIEGAIGAWHLVKREVLPALIRARAAPPPKVTRGGLPVGARQRRSLSP
jgi:hypothetical protein